MKAMKNIWAIIVLTMTNLLRSRVYLGLVFFMLLMLAASQLFSYFTFEEEIKIVMDVGLAGLTMMGLLTAVFTTAWSLPTDLEQKTLFMVLSYPVSKTQILLGKFISCSLSVLCNLFFMGLMFWVLVLFKLQDKGVDFQYLSMQLGKTFILIVMESIVSVGILLLMSIYFTPVINIVMFLFIFILGHAAGMIEVAIIKTEFIFFSIIRFLFIFIPDLTYFNIRDAVVLNQVVSWHYVEWAVLYGGLYTGIMVALSCYLFEKKEIV